METNEAKPPLNPSICDFEMCLSNRVFCASEGLTCVFGVKYCLVQAQSILAWFDVCFFVIFHNLSSVAQINIAYIIRFQLLCHMFSSISYKYLDAMSFLKKCRYTYTNLNVSNTILKFSLWKFRRYKTKFRIITVIFMSSYLSN